MIHLARVEGPDADSDIKSQPLIQGFVIARTACENKPDPGVPMIAREGIQCLQTPVAKIRPYLVQAVQEQSERTCREPLINLRRDDVIPFADFCGHPRMKVGVASGPARQQQNNWYRRVRISLGVAEQILG